MEKMRDKTVAVIEKYVHIESWQYQLACSSKELNY